MANIAQAGGGSDGDVSLKHAQEERDKVLQDLTRQRATLEATQKDLRERKAEVERLRQMQESLKSELAKQQAEVDRWKAEAEKSRAAAAQAQAALATAASSLASANGTAAGEENNRLRPNAANNKFGTYSLSTPSLSFPLRLVSRQEGTRGGSGADFADASAACGSSRCQQGTRPESACVA
jgi:flagellar capping protein FliD